MSNFSDHIDGVKQLNEILDSNGCPESERRVQVGLFYMGELALSMAKMADDIHKISRTLEKMNRRRA